MGFGNLYNRLGGLSGLCQPSGAGVANPESITHACYRSLFFWAYCIEHRPPG
jgi:hypothetical protein